MRVRVRLQRCLQKDPKQRLRDIGDARISLDEVLSGGPESALVGTPEAAVPRWHRTTRWAAGVLTVAVASVATWILKPASVPGPVESMRFSPLLRAATSQKS